MSIYIITFIGRLILEYDEGKQEEKEIYLKEKQMYFDHEYKIIELGLKQNSTHQSIKEAQSDKQQSSSIDKK